jgi:hypothetical protein
LGIGVQRKQKWEPVVNRKNLFKRLQSIKVEYSTILCGDIFEQRELKWGEHLLRGFRQDKGFVATKF